MQTSNPDTPYCNPQKTQQTAGLFCITAKCPILDLPVTARVI
ncbi:hypothetical protein [Moraxella lacunata]